MIEDRPWVGLLIGLAAMTPFVVQASIFLRNQRRHRSWVPTTAVALFTHTSSNSDGVRTHRASYNYTDTEGRTRSGRGEINHHANNGEQLPILVDPEDPSRSQPRRGIGVGHWIAGSLGFLLFVVGVFGVAQATHILLTGAMLGE